MRGTHGIRVHIVEEAPADQYLIPLFVKNAMGTSVRSYLRGKLVDSALDFQCAFLVLCRKLFIPLHARPSFFYPPRNKIATVLNRLHKVRKYSV